MTSHCGQALTLTYQLLYDLTQSCFFDLILFSTFLLCFNHNGFLFVLLTCQASSWLKVSVLAMSSVWNMSRFLWILLFIIYISPSELPGLRGHPCWPRIQKFSSPKLLQCPIPYLPHARTSPWNDLFYVFICMLAACFLPRDGRVFVLPTVASPVLDTHKWPFSICQPTDWLETVGRNN